MARYFFHVFCGSDVHMDENGQDFSDLKGAKTRATTIAKELAEDGYCVGSVCIFDKDGNELDGVPIGPTPPEATKSRFRSPPHFHVSPSKIASPNRRSISSRASAALI